MKTAQQWQTDLAGETSVQSIEAIQADALSHALGLLLNAADVDQGVDAISKEVSVLVPKLTPQQSYRAGATLGEAFKSRKR